MHSELTHLSLSLYVLWPSMANGAAIGIKASGYLDDL